MVTVFTSKNLKFRINERDHNPPHVHVVGAGAEVRINLLTLEFMDEQTEYSNRSLRMILEEVTKRKDLLMNEWERLHGKK